METLIITGGAGFIGSHVVRRFVQNHASLHILNIDKLTYAGNLANLKDIASAENYEFIKGDIGDSKFVNKVFNTYNPNGIIHLAAESHVDRSISHPLDFVMTNVVGTVNLLNAAKSHKKPNFRFYHISTDEVYGELTESGYFTEQTKYDPHSPYSASKASSDHFVRAYHDTFGIDVVLSNCSNNYGSHQFPEKLIPLAINNIKHQKPVPIYGDGSNIRDWLWVEDHARAIEKVYFNGKTRETYNIGGHNEWTNLDLVRLLCALMDEKLNRPMGTSKKLITFVRDRAGHDVRYAIDATKIENELGWKPSLQFKEGLSKTIDWYLANEDWMGNITSGSYQEYYKKMYGTN